MRVRVSVRLGVRVGLTVRVGSRCEGSINYSVSIPSNIYYLMIRPCVSLFHHCITENLRSISGKDQMVFHIINDQIYKNNEILTSIPLKRKA